MFWRAHAGKHDWHPFDVVRGLEVRQTTGRLRTNRWQVRDATGQIVTLDDTAFDQLRTGGKRPEGLR